MITAVTAQNSHEVRAIHPLPASMITSQIETLFDDFNIAAVKTGMLGDKEMVAAVADTLNRYPVGALVVDPVMVSTSGNALLKDEAVSLLKERLLPQTTLLTPNLPEAAVLLDQPEPQSLAEMKDAAAALHKLGPTAVLLKGGHLQTDPEQSVDLLFDGQVFQEFPARRIKTQNTHGTGCTLASAVTALLSRGYPLSAAVAGAKRYISTAIAAADQLEVGQGHGPLHHFYSLWGDSRLDP